jgi:hypothetical protein
MMEPSIVLELVYDELNYHMNIDFMLVYWYEGKKKLNRDNLCSHDSVEEALAELISEGFRGDIFSSIVLIFSKSYCTY